MQESCWVITDTAMGKRNKVRRPGFPWGTMKTNWTPTAASNIKEWMRGLEGDASKAELRKNKMSNWGTERKNTSPQHLSRSRRHCRRQGAPWLLRDTSSESPSSGGGSLDWGSKWSSHWLTMMRGSRESNWTGRAGRGPRVKVNLLIFKDEKTKDALTYSSW